MNLLIRKIEARAVIIIWRFIHEKILKIVWVWHTLIFLYFENLEKLE